MNWSGADNMGTTSAPSISAGWRARSKDHLEGSAASIYGYTIGLRGF